MSVRSFGNIISLLHFDFPYVGENNTGLLDEVTQSASTWTASGAKFYGSEAPNDGSESFTPCWGYRCIYTANSAAGLLTQNASIINAIKSKNAELEFMFCFKDAAQQKPIISLASSTGEILAVYFSSGKIANSLTGTPTVSSTTLQANSWHNLLLRFTSSNIALLVDAVSVGTISYPSNFSDITTLSVAPSFTGWLDELVVRKSARVSHSKPSTPYQASLDLNALGGFGSGKLGNINFVQSTRINSYAFVSAGSNSTITVSNIEAGTLDTFRAGDEIMLHATAPRNSSVFDKTGTYIFRTIAAISGSSFTLTQSIAPWVNSGIFRDYYVQAVSIPHFNSITIAQTCELTPLIYIASKHTGGIIAFRTKGDCTVNGKILTLGYGCPRTDLLVMSNSLLADRFLFNTGGGIFIACGGKFSATSSARIGASWDGSAKAGQPVSKSKGSGGGAGYGGGGGSDNDSDATGGNGGVGGGGGGQDAGPGTGPSKAGDAGANGRTGGLGWNNNSPDNNHKGGSQGITAGAVGTERGGGGALGNSATLGKGFASSGASLILIAKTLNADAASISTGGEGGIPGSYYATGGGGSGLCYIACEGVK